VGVDLGVVAHNFEAAAAAAKEDGSIISQVR